MTRFLMTVVALVVGAAVCLGDAFIKVPLCRQEKSFTCGVAATQSVLAFYGVVDGIRQDQLAKSLRTTRNGTRYQKIMDYAESLGFAADARSMTLEELKALLDAGQPVILAIQAWADALPHDYTDDWKDGHYVVAIGYDATRMFFMDPSTLGNYTYIPTEAFLARWHDIDGRKTKVVHWGIVLNRGRPIYDPEAILLLE